MSTFRGSLANVTVINYWQPTRFPLTNEQVESAIAHLPDRHTWRFAPMYFGAFYKQILIRWCGGGIEVRDYARIGLERFLNIVDSENPYYAGMVDRMLEGQRLREVARERDIQDREVADIIGDLRRDDEIQQLVRDDSYANAIRFLQEWSDNDPSHFKFVWERKL